MLIRLFFTYTFTLLFTSVFCQKVIRQSIGSMGKTYDSSGLMIQQSTGVVYNTKPSYDTELESRPGFIQPNNISIDVLNSSFTKPILINVFPNPTAYNVAFKTEENLENLVLTVNNVAGELIFSENLSSLENYFLNCKAWPSGNYFIKLIDENQRIYIAKLTKN